MLTGNTKAEIKDQKLILTRDFKASPVLLFEVWSNCEHLKDWWGPKEWPMDECEMDFRKGGQWCYCLRGPNEGDESWGMATYQEINEPEKIVYIEQFTDAEGNVVESMPDMIITVQFIAQSGKRSQRITVDFESNEKRDKIVELGKAEGMDSSLDRLEGYLSQILQN